MKVINLFAGPGAGKSTTAAGLFNVMKLAGHKVELVTEFAKELVWDDQHKILKDQLFLLSEQHRRINRLRDHDIEYVVTDSPILLNLAYKVEGYFENFEPLVVEIFQSFQNKNIVLQRVKPYLQYGRSQSEDEARGLDIIISNLLDKYQPNNYTPIIGDEHAPKIIYQRIIEGTL